MERDAHLVWIDEQPSSIKPIVDWLERQGFKGTISTSVESFPRDLMMLSESGIRVSAVIVDVMMPPPPGSHVLRHRVGLAHIILPIRAGHFAPVLPRDIAIAALTSNADFEINEEISAADAEVFFKGVAPELLLSWINSIRQE